MLLRPTRPISLRGNIQDVVNYLLRWQLRFVNARSHKYLNRFRCRGRLKSSLNGLKALSHPANVERMPKRVPYIILRAQTLIDPIYRTMMCGFPYYFLR